MTGRKVLRSTGLVGLEIAAARGTGGFRGGAAAGAGADVGLTVWTALIGGLDWVDLLGALVTVLVDLLGALLTGFVLISEGAFG